MTIIFVGVDGGATKCTVRVENEAGAILGRSISTPANIRLSVEVTWKSIYAGLTPILKQHGLSAKEYVIHAGMGLAGLEMIEAQQDFMRHDHGFRSLVLSSDAHVACLGAHEGQDGAVILIGTGVVGFQLFQGMTSKVAGYGFPHDDIGGGAWLGLQAVQVTLQWLDGRLPFSGLANALHLHFQQDMNQLVMWANRAQSTQFASLAPLVIQQSEQQDPMAISIMQQAAASIERTWQSLKVRQNEWNVSLPCALLGGIAPYLLPYLSSELTATLRASLNTPDAGAILLARRSLHRAHCH